MLKKATFLTASALSVVATLTVSTASFWFVYQNETPAELLSK
ncbi:MAG: cyclic lactone autoinducer peptide [Candidatus Pristimantibacillus lignocellulolyticus]|uniref:Cyclic lactone autoinducer peptide n=1 Tax=Candidatus Pristimantibacillus lignocellulolyticus TaxID=2994561 RepID=A0A9J6ZFI2_9BACL|nr:MAG: cyclic lactone autoinducer peptide [Candidatus Pristimantibacillus lignocellulolyticus]